MIAISVMVAIAMLVMVAIVISVVKKKKVLNVFEQAPDLEVHMSISHS